MRNRFITVIIAIILLNISLFAQGDFRRESSIYFSSENTNLFNLSQDEELKIALKLLEEANGINEVNLKDLMDRYSYSLAIEKIDRDRAAFIIRFNYAGLNLPKYISHNRNFLWERLYTDTHIAFDLGKNYIYSFDNEYLTISNNINLFFQTEELKYVKNPYSIYSWDLYKTFFEGEDYEYAYLLGEKKEAVFISDNKSKSKIFHKLEQDIELEQEKIEVKLIPEVKKIIYDRFSHDLVALFQELLPYFDPVEIELEGLTKASYSVWAKDSIYSVFKSDNKQESIESFRNALEAYVFYRPKGLGIMESDIEEIYYIELPIIYKRIYMTYIEDKDTGAFIVSDKLQTLEQIRDDSIEKNILILDPQVNSIFDFENSIKVEGYYENGIYIKVEERNVEWIF